MTQVHKDCWPWMLDAVDVCVTRNSYSAQAPSIRQDSQS